MVEGCATKKTGKPKWLRRPLPAGPEYERVRRLLKESKLNTVCQEAKCPNQFECFGKGTATFMILGERCSRNCGFCAVSHGPQGLPDPQEAARVAEAVAYLQLRYAVITSVTRDDLSDGGASFFSDTIHLVKERCPRTLVEVLIPDLQGNWPALHGILDAGPDVLNHNIETVEELYPKVRPQARYDRSLALLREVKKYAPEMVTKSGMMVGLGESFEQLGKTWDDLLAAGCDILTIGQYLQPSAAHLEVARFVPPEELSGVADKALALGFKAVAAAPFVRSSYQAEQLYRQACRSTK